MKTANSFVKMFSGEFVGKVLGGTKLQTIRRIPMRKRMPETGDIMYCRKWKGEPMRSNQVDLCTVKIVSVLGIKIAYECLIVGGLHIVGKGNRDTFSRRDGFSNWDELMNWIDKTYGVPFEGILIEWDKI